MLARDVAAARVDQREGIERVAGLVREASEEASRVAAEAKATVVDELGVLWQLAEAMEKKGGRRRARRTRRERRRWRRSERRPQRSSRRRRRRNAPRKPPKHSPDARDARRRRREAFARVFRVFGAFDVSRKRDDVFTARMDPEQWALLGERLTRLEDASASAAAEAAEAAGKAVGRMRAGVREDLRGVSAALAAAAENAALSAAESAKARERRRRTDATRGDAETPSGAEPPTEREARARGGSVFGRGGVGITGDADHRRRDYRSSSRDGRRF